MAEGEGDLGTAYGGQAEDINDKLLLDLAWERQQKKVSGSMFVVCGKLQISLLIRVWKSS